VFHAPNGTFRGNANLLNNPLLALACSTKPAAGIVLQAYDLASALRDNAVPVISGFHTPIERDCLHFLLKGTQPVVICPARGIENMRLPLEWKAPLAEGRLLVVSPFPSHQRRVTAALAAERNRFVAKLCTAAVVIHATPGSRTEQWCREVLALGKPLWTLGAPENAHLVALGARPFGVERLPRFFEGEEGEEGEKEIDG
jgi:predicted Rossmann fold nucleotide-binding protein DprA/Smf involved in DNA uptake